MNVYFESLLSHMKSHGPYREMPGALRYLQALLARSDVEVAYATGGWRETAKHKLLSAGFPTDGIPLASADDHQDRAQIMLYALGQLRGPFLSVTYFGDGVWDQKCAAQLGWEFVAVGHKLGGLLDFASLSPDYALPQSASP